MMRYGLTPVETHDGLFVKRDDLYTPYGKGDVNGGKLRQCHALLHDADPAGVVTACSVHSPQAPICAAVAREMGIPCWVLYGGTTHERLRKLPMPRLAAQHGARLLIAARTGRHNVLYARAKQLAAERGWFVAEYAFNMLQKPDLMLGAISDQVANLPDCERLYLTCGSGITACGVMRGLLEYGKPVREVHLYATAPSRRKLIEGFGYHREFDIRYHDMFHEPGFHYEQPVPYSMDGIVLHPNYEAKAYRRMLAEGVDPAGALFWIVGAKPGLPGAK